MRPSRPRALPRTHDKPPALDERGPAVRSIAFNTRNQSGRRDSNPRHQAWKASALPTELLPQNDPTILILP